MSFPCLAHLSVHLHKGAINIQAVYRNESLIDRAYGNYSASASSKPTLRSRPARSRRADDHR